MVATKQFSEIPANPPFVSFLWLAAGQPATFVPLLFPDCLLYAKYPYQREECQLIES